MAYALANWRMSLAQYWKDLRRTAGLAHVSQWRFFFAPESLAITKSAVQWISMPSAESAWMSGKNVGMKRCEPNGRHGKTKEALPSKLENESAIWVGGFTKRSSHTVVGRSHTVTRSSSSDLGRETKDRGGLLAIVCCTRIATTFM
jgi:hypothetical protein